MLLIFLGLFVLSVIGTYGARLLIDHEVKSVLGRKRMKKDIAQLKDHYVVCGFGRIGSVICDELNRAGLVFVIIEIEDSLVLNAENLGYRIIKGDATSDSVLKQAGVDRAHGVVAALNSDAHNLFISLAARELNTDVEIIARGEETGIESRLIRAGANRVVSPLKLGGSQIAHMILGDLKSKSKKQEAAADMGQLMMQQIQNTRNIQVCAEDLLEQASGVLAVAIQRADGRKEIMPSLNTMLEPKDTLFVCRATSTP
jgi:voltage-gated potassium channel